MSKCNIAAAECYAMGNIYVSTCTTEWLHWCNLLQLQLLWLSGYSMHDSNNKKTKYSSVEFTIIAAEAGSISKNNQRTKTTHYKQKTTKLTLDCSCFLLWQAKTSCFSRICLHHDGKVNHLHTWFLITKNTGSKTQKGKANRGKNLSANTFIVSIRLIWCWWSLKAVMSENTILLKSPLKV